MFYLIFSVIALFSIRFSYSQQEYRFAQYMYTPAVINPGFAGIEGVMNVSLLYRAQWVGVEGAPVTQVLSLDTAVNDRVGLGLNFVKDEIGPSSNISSHVNFSYKFPITNNGLNFSFGLKGGMESLNVDYSKLSVYMYNETLSNVSEHFPVIGIGSYLYTSNWFLGVSTPNLLSTSYFNEQTLSAISTKRHYYILGGGSFKLKEKLTIKPSFLYYTVSGAPSVIDLTVSALYNDSLLLGFSYRDANSMAALFNIKISNKLSIGYSYESDRSQLASYSSGSHEVLLRFKFYKTKTFTKEPILWSY